MVTKYQKRISGPLLDRIDIYIEVSRVDYEKLSGDRMGASESIRKRVPAACNIQLTRFANIESSNIVANAEMRVGEIGQFCKLQADGQSRCGQRHCAVHEPIASVLLLCSHCPTCWAG